MLVIPEIEIKQGMCVHAHHQNNQLGSVVRLNPLEVAERWIEAGATRLHIIDVDGVMSGRPENPKVIRQIKQNYPDIIVQSQGGLVDEDSLLIALDVGADFLVLSNKLTKKPKMIEDLVLEFPGKLIAAIDACNGLLKSSNGQSVSLETTLNHMSDVGVESIFFTDIPSSGHVTPQNAVHAAQLAAQNDLEMLANGGVTTMQELQSLEQHVFEQLQGLIVGHSIYDETLDLAEAINYAKQRSSQPLQEAS